ncbi:hypothetical protein OY671_011797, partial [Metschnikowia pulcherrima]
EFGASEIPGTPSYLAPEMFAGNLGDEATDLYASGVTSWRSFTGHYPYGEIEAFSRPRFRKSEAPSSSRPELPAWLDAASMRAVSVDPEERFGDAIGSSRALEGGAAVERVDSRAVPSIERQPVRFWQGVALISRVASIAALIH